MQDVYHTAAMVAALVLVSCGGKSEPPGPSVEPGTPPEVAPEEDDPETDTACEPLPFVETIDIAEASGAVMIDAGLLVVSDSGNHGAYVILDPDTGAVLEEGAVPLAEAADDLEGVAHLGDRIAALTSAGWIHEYRRSDGGFELAAAPYPIAAPPWRCEKDQTNCGPNWEGLCLGEVAIEGSRCDGFAASKRDGALVCVVDDGGQLTLVPEVQIDVAPGRTLAGCAISEGRIWAVTNMLGANAVLEVSSDGAATPRLSMAPGSTEAVAAAGDVVYRFSDTANRPSIAGRYRCP